MPHPRSLGAPAFLAVAIAAAVFFSAARNKDTGILTDVERIAALGEEAPLALRESVADRIEANPKETSALLLPALKDPKTSETRLTIYVWALGLSRDPDAAEAIIAAANRSKTDRALANCYRALAMIGGKKSGEFLLSALDGTSSGELRFDVFNALGQMQYEAALPKTIEILKQNPKPNYWQSVFVFGKMGDKAVPFLTKKIADENRNVRGNATSVLGQWLIAPEIAEPLRERFWKEEDPEIRTLILSCLEQTVPDLDAIKKFSEAAVSKEKNKQVLKYARETLDNLGKMEADVAAFRKKKNVSAAVFQTEYDRLFKSAGKNGDYEALSAASAPGDEPKLARLRERILQRDSDEAFYDYQKINHIIIFNRFMKKP